MQTKNYITFIKKNSFTFKKATANGKYYFLNFIEITWLLSKYAWFSLVFLVTCSWIAASSEMILESIDGTEHMFENARSIMFNIRPWGNVFSIMLV